MRVSLRLYFFQPSLHYSSLLLAKKKSVEDTYEKMNPREHVLARPDMYVGSTDPMIEPQWILAKSKHPIDKMESLEQCKYCPAMYKIFDEILVNSADNKVRDDSQKYVKVWVDKSSGKVVVENDGKGIPVVKHKKYALWVPEMIFGHMLTSSNYSDDESRVTGGRFGYGAKLTNIFSKEFTVETVHNNKKFRMTWTENMGTHTEADITDTNENDYTRVTFTPDFARLSMAKGFQSDNTIDLMCRRVCDIAGVTNSSLDVYLNDTKVKAASFQEYARMYPMEEKAVEHFEVLSPHWEVGLRTTKGDGFEHVSFVNAIATSRGGAHVNYLADQVVDAVTAAALKQSKTALESKSVRPFLMLF
eukprot:PhF_6_TR607/c1_g1_i1/m.755/K03164/TOP2; DNA topoisomerase II